MAVTVIMSTYNGEKYLREQIDSILCQEKVDIILFVRDDGSTDQTLEILGEYAERHNNIIISEGKNLGIGRSFFEALSKAPDAPFYAFADQDDVWLPEKIIAGIRALESFMCDGDAIPLLYTCRTVPVDQELRQLKIRKRYPRITFGSALLENSSSGCTMVFNRRARELFLRFPSEYICIHDWDLLRIVLAADGRVFQDKTGYVLYRQHSANSVGADESWKRRATKILNSHLFRELKGRRESAERIREVFQDVIPEKNRRILDSFCDYRKTFSSRMAIVRSKEITRSDRIDNYVFKALFLIGLL